jgi:Ca-activated chloride channel family protein
MSEFRFHSPHWLLLLPLAVWACWHAARPAWRASVLYSNTAALKALPVTLAQKIKRLLPWLNALGLCLLILGLSRPQLGVSESRINTEGIAIELALDISGSMEAMDFVIDEKSVSRINAVKHVVHAFVNGSKADGLSGRKNDLLGLVAFTGVADSRCPLTLDHGALSEIVKTLECPKPITNSRGELLNQEELQTAIGDGLTAGVNRLKESKAKSKIVILLTDGNNNAGIIDPREAAKVAETFGIKVYTICIGTNDIVQFPVQDAFGGTQMVPRRFPIDEKLLEDIADTTKGKYFHAYGLKPLTNVYAEIDRLEKSKVEETRYTEYSEQMAWLALPGLALMVGVFVLGATRFRSLP